MRPLRQDETVTALEVFPGGSALGRAAANHFVHMAQEAVSGRGRFLVALSGGSTPLVTYALLGSTTQQYSGRVDWGQVHVFWGDERCVGPDDAESNYRMARVTLLDRVGIPEQNVHRIEGELPPGEAARQYEQELRRELGPEGRLDLALLGLGVDGHIASLFPGTAAVEEKERWVVAHLVDSVGGWRVTLTPPILTSCRQVTFIVSGREKAEPLRAALEDPQDPEVRPTAVFPLAGTPVLWLVDQAAAADLQ
jgi:6-phosphogluconolactonase